MVEILSQSFHHNAPLTLINFIPRSFNPAMPRHTHPMHTHKQCSVYDLANIHEKGEKRESGMNSVPQGARRWIQDSLLTVSPSEKTHLPVTFLPPPPGIDAPLCTTQSVLYFSFFHIWKVFRRTCTVM